MTGTNPAGVQYLSDDGGSGVCLGNSVTDLIGFYGKAPIVKATVTLGAGTTTTLLKADVLAILTALSNLGLVTAA